MQIIRVFKRGAWLGAVATFSGPDAEKALQASAYATDPAFLILR